ncbi:MAG: hypothetical protein AB8B56_20320 [Crocinitomicaceae bacterium]
MELLLITKTYIIMNYMYKTVTLTSFVFLFLLIGTSCKKDSCTPPDVTQNIIGTWKAKNTENLIEFKTDGTYTDDNEYLLGFSSGGVNYSDRTYAISGDSLHLTVSDPNGSGFASSSYLIEANKCEEIIVSTNLLISITTTLEKQ